MCKKIYAQACVVQKSPKQKNTKKFIQRKCQHLYIPYSETCTIKFIPNVEKSIKHLPDQVEAEDWRSKIAILSLDN